MTENTVQTVVDGVPVTIRPIHASDSAMEAQFVRHLSAETRRLRFFGGVQELSTPELRLLCDVDGQNSMAFVATTQQNGLETAIGVSRYAPSLQHGAREMALTIADQWQQKGLAELLMAQLIAYARNHSVERLYSVELAENHGMRQLARTLGMREESDSEDAGQVIYTLAL